MTIVNTKDVSELQDHLHLEQAAYNSNLYALRGRLL